MSGLMNSGTVGLRVLAGAGEHSAPVTHWAGLIAPTIALLALLTGVRRLMYRGWRKRAARQQDLLAPGIAGKATGGEGAAPITWRLGDRRLDTGFHPRSRQDRARLLEEINTVAEEGELA
jgi:hypothetical protein